MHTIVARIQLTLHYQNLTIGLFAARYADEPTPLPLSRRPLRASQGVVHSEEHRHTHWVSLLVLAVEYKEEE